MLRPSRSLRFCRRTSLRLPCRNIFANIRAGLGSAGTMTPLLVYDWLEGPLLLSITEGKRVT